MVRLLDALLGAYQLVLSPFVGGHCRFHPTCSDYARESIARHGASGGSWLAAKRLARCHPLSRGGFDPVPSTDRADTGAPCELAARGSLAAEAAQHAHE